MGQRDLPLFRILARAIAFEATNLFTLFRLTWLPLAVLLTTQIVAGRLIVEYAGATTPDAIEAVRDTRPARMFAILTQSIALIAVAVRVHRIILFDDRRPGEYFAFRFGWTEVQYFAMGALTVAGFFAIAIPTMFLLSSLYDRFGIAPGFEGKTFWQALAAMAPVILAVVIVYWALMRVALWPPATVAKGLGGLPEALRLTKGHSFSLFWLFQIAGLLFVAAYALVEHVLGKLVSGALPFVGIAGRPEVYGFFTLPRWERFAEWPSAPEVAGEFAFLFFTTTYIAAIMSYAYLALKDLEGETDAQAAPPHTAAAE